MNKETNPSELWRIPPKNQVRHLIDKYVKSLDVPEGQINTRAITFNALYQDEDKPKGILWRATKKMEPLIGMHSFLSEHGIKIKAVKYYGEIHSIWFYCIID